MKTPRPTPLTARFVKAVKQPGRYGDGRGSAGLSLLVKETNVPGRLSKTWSQRIVIDGKVVMIGLGRYGDLTLAEAREKAFENRRAVALGSDPRAKVQQDDIPNFQQAVEKVIALHGDGWKNPERAKQQWRSSLETYAYPRLGKMEVSAITARDIQKVLVPHWSTKRAVMEKVKTRIGLVMKWAIANNLRSDNPLPAVVASLPKNGVKKSHHKALPWEQVADAIKTVRQSNARGATKLAFEFLVLTTARSGEVRNMVWDEIDFDNAIWTVPPEKHKEGKQHRVPLSDRAIEVLTEAGMYRDAMGLVFPSQTGRPLSDNTISKLLRNLNIPAVPHGFRSSFRDWCGDTGQPRDAAEMALGHSLGAVESACARSDLLERRRELMVKWADVIA